MGLGIDLGSNGVNPNDPGDSDVGANNQQNYPVLTAVTLLGNDVGIDGILDSIPNTTYVIEFFANDGCDGSGNGEGARLLGTETAVTDAAGMVNYSVTLTAPVLNGEAITATATDPSGNTSEFSACFAVAAPPSPINIIDVSPNNAAFDIDNSETVSVTFDLDVDASTISNQTFTVRGEQTGVYTGSYTTNNSLVQFDNHLDFKPGEEIFVALSQDIQSTDGASLSPYSWQFYAAVDSGFGTFVDSGQALGNLRSHGIALGDLDGDGDLDAFVGNIGITSSQGQPDIVWLNDGSGSFTDSGQNLGSNSQSYHLVLGDLDNDGDLDAFTANFTGGNRVYLNNGGNQGGTEGVFSESNQQLGSSSSLGVALADLDGDGDLDAYVANYYSQPNRVWLNDGLGNFADSGQTLGNSNSNDVALGDLDGDGDLDAFVGNDDGQPDRVWLNDGHGIFTDSGQALGNTSTLGGVSLGDLDGDGDLDAFVGVGSGSNRVWLNDGTGGFTPGQVTGGTQNTHGSTLGDLDGDGDLDAFIANVSGTPNEVWLNNGDGTFTLSGTYGNSYSEGIALGDVDSDGDLDAFVANDNQPNKVWFNHPLNQPPTADNDSFSTNEDVILHEGSPGVLDGDVDVDGDTLTAILDTTTSNGILTLNSDGSFDYTPYADFCGQDSFTYHANDGMVDSNIATVTIDVVCVNDPPAVDAGGPYDVAEGGSILVESLGSDPEDDTLTYDWDLDNDGNFETPGQNVIFSAENLTGPATHTIAVQVTDSGGLSTTDQTTVDILQGVCPSQVILYDDFYSSALDTAIWRTDTNSSGSGYNIQDGVLFLDSGTTFGGGFAVYSNQEFTPVDYKTFSLEMKTRWDIVPDAGTGFGLRRISSGFAIAGTDRLTGEFIIRTLEDEPGTPDTFVIGIDPETSHTYRIEFRDNSLFFYVDNVLEETITQNVPTSIQMPIFFSPGSPGGLHNIMEVDSVKVTATLNCAPDAADDNYNTNEDITLNVPSPGVLSNDTDANNDALTVALDNTTSNGDLTLASDGSFAYIPDADFCGLDSFSYHANDGSADSNIATVTIDVACVNDAPVADDDSYSVNEDGVLNEPTPGVLDGDMDVEGDALTAVQDTTTSNGVLTFNSDGSFDYTPDANFCGSDGFTYHANDGALDSNIATVTIDVICVNDAPVADDDSYSVNEDGVLNEPAPGVLDGDTDIEGDALTAVLDTTTNNGTLILNPDGSFTYTPNPDYCGQDSFTYHANDGFDDSNIATATIDVTCINDVPVADDDTYSTNEDTVLNITAPGVLDNDTDADGDVLTAVLATTTSDGFLTFNSDGSFSYMPDANYCGQDGFTYYANDGNVNSQVATVIIDVVCVNDDPLAADDDMTTDEDTAVTIDVLANDTDVDIGDVLTVITVTQGNDGTAANNGTDVTYTPDADYCGGDSFTYTVSDGNGGTDSATVTVTINCVNDDPIADNDNYNATEGTTLNVAAPGVLANDFDVDGDSLTAVLDTTTSDGDLTLNSDGSFSYEPDTDFCGQDSFTYHANDNILDSNIAIVTIDVVCINDAPDITVDYASVVVNESDTAVNNGSFSDVDSTTVTLSASVGTVIDTGNGTWSWSFTTSDGPADGQIVTITADDGEASSAVTFSLTVTNVAPSVDTLIVPLTPIDANDQSNFTVDVTFSDPAGVADEFYTCEFDLDYDGVTFTADVTVSNVTGTSCSTPLNYAEPGVFTVKVVVTDKDGDSGTATADDFIVIYDPSGGFVTGGGWIWSESGWCQLTPICAGAEGKANFGFVSKYKKGASVPTGNTEFNFSAGNLNFHSDEYEWLVVNQGGTNAQYKGSGTINGDLAPNGEMYKFMIWATDGDNANPVQDDSFRIKIWYEDSGEIVIYDNGTDQIIGGGNIKIHNDN